MDTSLFAMAILILKFTNHSWMTLFFIFFNEIETGIKVNSILTNLSEITEGNFKSPNKKTKQNSLIFAAKDKWIWTNYIKAKIDKSQKNSKFCVHRKNEEMVKNIVSECSKLAQNKYKNRHDKVQCYSWKWANNLNSTMEINGLSTNSRTVLENKKE